MSIIAKFKFLIVDVLLSRLKIYVPPSPYKINGKNFFSPGSTQGQCMHPETPIVISAQQFVVVDQCGPRYYTWRYRRQNNESGTNGTPPSPWSQYL
jgi:hypothetical protein